MDTDPKRNACHKEFGKLSGSGKSTRHATSMRSLGKGPQVQTKAPSVVTHRDTQECSENLTNPAVFLPLDGSRTNDSTAMFRSNTCNTNLLRLCLTRRRKLLIVVQKRSGERHCFPQCVQLAENMLPTYGFSNSLMRYLKKKTPTGLQKAAFQQLPSTSLTLPQIPILGGFNEAMPSNTAVLRAADPIARTSSCCFKRMLRHMHQLLNRHDA